MESLVVIAIIAVLGVILVPVVNSVIRKSGHTVCQSNLRQMAMATLIYVSEHNGQLPSRTFINTSNNYGIRSYLDLNEKSSDVGGDDSTIFTCPVIQSGSFPSAERFALTYAINGHINYQSHLAEADKNTAVVENFHDILYPSQAMIFTDGRKGAAASERPGHYRYSNNIRAAQWNKQILQFPHDGRQNVAFLDGRVEALNWEDAPQGDANDPFWTGGILSKK